MMKGVIAAFLLMLSACSPTATDNYKFEKAQFEHKQLAVNVVTVDNVEQINEAVKKFGVKPDANRQIMAFSLVNERHNRCTIYMVDPKRRYMPEFIGHELTHCIYGQFHPSRP